MSINKERQIDQERVQQRREIRFRAAGSAQRTLEHQYGEQVKVIIEEVSPDLVADSTNNVEVMPGVAGIVQDHLTGIDSIRAAVEAASQEGDITYDLPEAA
ncbi:MAG: hypothetical protein QG553_432 [Patescibacteria group bacterium]|nr:hypothetical protein [Patescibacteria group bacterium]